MSPRPTPPDKDRAGETVTIKTPKQGAALTAPPATVTVSGSSAGCDSIVVSLENVQGSPKYGEATTAPDGQGNWTVTFPVTGLAGTDGFPAVVIARGFKAMQRLPVAVDSHNVTWTQP